MREAWRSRPIESTATCGAGKILILGSPRSGTTWLGKLFDSHPDALYRHEPDIVCRPNSLPKSIPPGGEAAYIETARAYLDQLAAVRTLKAAGPLPVFRKRHRSSLGRLIRTGSIIGVRGLEIATPGGNLASRIPIPDLISGRNPKIVIKSVSLLAYVRLFAKAWPLCRIIIIVRHPCGQVASFLRGIELGKFVATPYSELAKSDEAERLGLKIGQFSDLSLPEQLAWQWAFFNQRTLRDIAGLSNVKVLLYDEFAGNPLQGARELLEFSGLAWDAQVERFIGDSTRHHRTRYYGLHRNPLRADGGRRFPRMSSGGSRRWHHGRRSAGCFWRRYRPSQLTTQRYRRANARLRSAKACPSPLCSGARPTPRGAAAPRP